MTVCKTVPVPIVTMVTSSPIWGTVPKMEGFSRFNKPVSDWLEMLPLDSTALHM